MDLLKDPQIAPVLEHQLKNQLLGPYADFFRSLNLDAAKAEQLRSLLTERLISTYEVVNLSRDQDTEHVVQALESSKQKIDDEIRGVIGDDGFDSFSTYESTLGLRNTLKQLAKPLTFTNEPLTLEQIDSMVKAMSTSPRYEASTRLTYTTPSLKSTITVDQIQSAGRLLSPTQLKSLTSELQMQARARELEAQNSARFQQYLKTWADQSGRGP